MSHLLIADWLWLSTVILSLLTVLLQNASSFLFVDGIEPFFWPSVLHVALYKTVFFASILDLGPLNPKI